MSPREAMLIQIENREISNGNRVVTSCLDNHSEHIKAHREVINSLRWYKSESKLDKILYFFKLKQRPQPDPKTLKLVLDHIQEHINLLKDS